MLENLFLPLFIAVISAFIATQVGESLRKLFIFIVVIVVLYMAYSFISSDPVEFSDMKFSPESISKISRTDQSDGTKYENEYENEYEYENTIYKNQLSEFEEKNDNKGALQYMNSNDLSDNPQYFEQYSVFSQRYIDEVTQEAEAAYKNSGYEAALSIINNALTVLPGDQQLMNEKDIYVACVPVDLTTLTPYFEGTIDVFTDEVTDTLGNTYYSGVRGYMSTSDASTFDCYHIWDIGAKYNTLTATGIILEDDKGSKCKGMFRIYGDGVLLYEKTGIDSKTKPYEIEVDITGVTDLKIEMYGEGNMYWRGIDSVLVNVMLQRNK